MSMEGRGRTRWIRILILVLALTASRTNFPLFKREGSPRTAAPLAFNAGVPKHAKKSEGVTPSRRNVELRRTDWLQGRGADTTPYFQASFYSDHAKCLLCPTGVQQDLNPFLATADTRPLYLQLCGQAPQVSSLPPPL